MQELVRLLEYTKLECSLLSCRPDMPQRCISDHFSEVMQEYRTDSHMHIHRDPLEINHQR